MNARTALRPEWEHLLAATVITAITALAILTTPAQAQTTPPTDPQIVEIVEVANKIDIGYAKIALKKSKDKEVRGFAQQMVDDHSAVLKSVVDLAAKLNVKPEESDISKSLKTQAEETTKTLKADKGKAFDKAYIDNEVSYHQAVIDAMNKTLIPNAKNEQLKSALTGAVPLFEGHLEHAKKIQASL
jgi:putative membrane protein